jgi:HAD superfamily hydrolase (TIGR01662 family)
LITRAVFFDVDWTLIHPGPTFLGEGYKAFCARYGMDVDADRFHAAVAAAAPFLDSGDERYTDELFVVYTRKIVEGMGGTGPNLDACAQEIYREWAACQHFELYDDVPEVLRELSAAGLRIGLISNSHRCLASFQSHFELQGLITATVSSSVHGFLKPHPSIFAAALQLVDVAAADAVMVGDSLAHDVEGAMRVGMHGILLHRGETCPARAEELGVPVIRSLRDLPPLLSLA